MDILQEARELSNKSFFTHVFSTTDDGKAEIINVMQYALIGIIPVIVLNKIIQRFIPEADLDKSSLELLVEIFLQILIMFCGIIVIHRVITYIPTYSGFKYETMNFPNIVLAFLVIILSIQCKLGIKTNILYDRVLELWNGTSIDEYKKKIIKRNVRVTESMVQSQHIPSQSDTLDDTPNQQFLSPPESTGARGQGKQHQEDDNEGMISGPQPANGILGGGSGSFF